MESLEKCQDHLKSLEISNVFFLPCMAFPIISSLVIANFGEINLKCRTGERSNVRIQNPIFWGKLLTYFFQKGICRSAFSQIAQFINTLPDIFVHTCPFASITCTICTMKSRNSIFMPYYACLLLIVLFALLNNKNKN